MMVIDGRIYRKFISFYFCILININAESLNHMFVLLILITISNLHVLLDEITSLANGLGVEFQVIHQL